MGYLKNRLVVLAAIGWGALVLVFVGAPLRPVVADDQPAGELATVPSPAELERHVLDVLEVPRAKLLILGTFHFDDAGLDSYKPKHGVDILSEARQREVVEVVDRLAAFQPTHVAVEWPKARQERGDERYGEYRRGESEPDPNEVVQLGFRLAARMDHERVWLVDVKGRRYEPSIDRQAIAGEWGQEQLLDSPWWPRFEKLSQWSDELKTRIPLRDYLVFLNSEPVLRANAGQYFVGGFNLIRGEEYPGPDNLAGWWYDRNLRIYASVQALASSPDDRIVLVVGAGHVPILRHCARASPDIELVEVSDVLGRR